jgi:hypothetical protein
MVKKPQEWDLAVRQQEGHLQPAKWLIRADDIDAGTRGWRANPAFLSLAAQHIESSCEPAAYAPATMAIVEMTGDVPRHKKR